jgi:hypothetical protein
MKKRRLNPVIKDIIVYACFSMAGMYIVIRLLAFMVGIDL